MARKRRIIVSIATSADGFIARSDGSVDWLDRPAPALAGRVPGFAAPVGMPISESITESGSGTRKSAFRPHFFDPRRFLAHAYDLLETTEIVPIERWKTVHAGVE